MNSVKQGSILSTALFNLYLDELLIRLKLNGVGCHIGNQFAGALAYADDVILLSPSFTGLQNMLDVCKIYSNEFSLMFNENKSVCIKFSKVVTDNNIADVYLGENKLKWDNKVKHLGNFVSST